ncbi:MAG TPA: MFS transporter [Actinomycetota bacterium]
MGEGPARRGAVALLAQRDFGLYAVGSLLSNAGNFCQSIALSLLVFRLTRSTLLVGVVNFAQYAGVLLLAPLAGAAADRYERRRLLVASQLAAVLISGALALLVAAGRAGVGSVMVLAALLGVTTAFCFPAQKALVPALVEPADLHRAVGMDSMTMNLSKALGPALGALLVLRVGFAWAFAANCASYLALIVAVLVIRPRPQASGPGRDDDAAGGRGGGVLGALRVLRGEPELVLLLAVVAVLAIASDPAPTLGPGFAVHLYGRSDTVAGLLFGTFGIGAVLGALTIARPAARPYRRMALLLVGMAVANAAFALSGAGTLWLGLAGLAVAGGTYLAAQTQATTMIHESLDDARRGRVMALWTVAFVGTRPLASLADGALATVVGLRGAALLISLPLLAVALLVPVARRRQAERRASR